MVDFCKIKIDDKIIEVDLNMILIQVCEQVGIEVLCFCYYECLLIVGNCWMCLVEVVGGLFKFVVLCVMQVKDLCLGLEGVFFEIKINSFMVKKVCEGVMEFLLINYLLDCLICDQGGECDLQDQVVVYGVDFSCYCEFKCVSEDLNFGLLVEIYMMCCIFCICCVCFIIEVVGIIQMGQIGWGEDSEIISYLNEMLVLNMQGNIIDLCLVGVLVSKFYVFIVWFWELIKIESIDVMDVLGLNICIDIKGCEVMCILLCNNDGVNEEWIFDKICFVWDGLCCQCLDWFYLCVDGKLCLVSWFEVLEVVVCVMKGKKVVGLIGDLVLVEVVFSLK